MKHKQCIVEEIPTSGQSHPDPPFEQLPIHEFTMSLIAPKGCGKTTTIANLLDFYRGYFHTILVFSPTIRSDEKWDWVKNQELLVENVPLKKWLKKMNDQDDKEAIVGEKHDSALLQGLVNPEDKFTPFIPEDHFFDDYEAGSFREIMEEQKNVINVLKDHNQEKFLANRILIIFDDLVGSDLFRGNKGNYFTGVNTRHRHYSASFIMVSQGYKEIPKTIRNNFTCVILFEIGNDKEREVIYEEFSMGLKRDQWEELYAHAVKEQYSFMYLNVMKPDRTRRIMRNFTDYLTWTNSEENDE